MQRRFHVSAPTLCYTQFDCLFQNLHFWVGRNCAVGIATGYGLEGAAIESRQVWYSCNRPDHAWVHPATSAVSTGSISRGKAPEVWPWPLTKIYCRGSRKSRAIDLLPISVFVAYFRENFTFSVVSTETIKDNGSVLNATCSTVRIDRYCLMYRFKLLSLVWNQKALRYILLSIVIYYSAYKKFVLSRSPPPEHE